jgi:cell wall assembly regulator SMI1
MANAVIIFALLGMSVLAFRHLQRTLFYPRPRAMPQAVVEDVGVLLQQFDAVLSERAPEVLAALRPGLSAEQLREIETRYGLRLTEEMRALYRWRDGSPAEANARTIDLIPGHRFVPLEEAAEARQAMRRQVSSLSLLQRLAFAVFAGHRRNWLTVLDDGCGDGYFYDSARRRRGGWFFYHFAEDRHYWFFPSVASFLAGAIECYETGIYRSGRRGAAGEDHERSFELWRRYAGSPGGS